MVGSADLASRIGLFHTIGMPEETWALNEGQMTDDGWLDMEATILQEREKMFFDTLAQNDSIASKNGVSPRPCRRRAAMNAPLR